MRIERVLRGILRELIAANDIAMKSRHGDGNFAPIFKKLLADRTPTAEQAAEDAFFAKQEAEQLNAMMRRAEFIEQERAAMRNSLNVQVSAVPTVGGGDPDALKPAPQNAEIGVAGEPAKNDTAQPAVYGPLEPTDQQKIEAPVEEKKLDETKTTAPPPRASRNR